MNRTDIRAADIMATRLHTFAPENHVLDAIDLLLQHEISGAPVVGEGGRFLGTFSEKSSMIAFAVFEAERDRRCDENFRHIRAADVMKSDLVTVSENADAFAAISLLLQHGVSGLPVVDSKREFLGVFSERAAMRVIIDLTWNQIESGTVSAWMDRDRERVVTEHTPLASLRERFRDTHYRRFPVLKEGRLVGQVSRRDVLRAELNHVVNSYENSPGSLMLPEWEPRVPRQEWRIENFMNAAAKTISADADLMTIAQEFFTTSARRFPVVTDGRLIGQISRRDLLRSVQHLFPQRRAGAGPLYLSSTKSDVASVLG